MSQNILQLSVVSALNIFLTYDLFKLSSSDKSVIGKPNATKTDSISGPLTGDLIREGFMVKKSRKSDDRVYGVLTSEYFAYGKEEFHVTGPSTMEIRRVVPLAMAVVT